MFVPTGIKGFDDLIEGGLPRGGVIEVMGPTGTGKTIFALQYLYKGITEYDEPGLYISFAEKKRFLYRNVARFGWNLSGLEANKKFVFIEFPIAEVSQFIAQESAMFNMIVELGIERVVIDPVTPLTQLGDTEQKKIQNLSTLISTLKSWGTTTLLVSEPEEIRRTGLVPLVDGLIELARPKRDSYRIYTVEILKMHGVPFIAKTCPFKIGKEGIRVYPNQYLYD
jgi:circadian clock protein KaiC